jgi:hypothetical protein
MQLWFEALGAVLLAGAGAVLGRACSRLPGAWWAVGYVGPFLLVALIGIAVRVPAVSFMPPFSWLTEGRREYALAGLLTTWLLTTPLSRLPRAETRRLVVVFMAVTTLGMSVAVFLGPAMVRAKQAALTTVVDNDGVCLQSTDYNCGPAAAVTALRRLGLPAEEGRLAVLAHTSPVSGTPPDILADTLRREYTAHALTAEYRFFKSVADLRGAGEVLAIVYLGWLTEHYVAVLAVKEGEITVGDPLLGAKTMTHAEFARTWRHSGVVLKVVSVRKP